MNRKTHTVERCYPSGDGQHRVLVKGQALPFTCDEPLPEGTAVTLHNNHAQKAN